MDRAYHIARQGGVTRSEARAVAREASRMGRAGIYDSDVVNQADVKIAIFRGHSRMVKGEFFPGVVVEG
jgi:hypothetical protein